MKNKSSYFCEGVKYYLKVSVVTGSYYCFKVYQDGTSRMVKENNFKERLPKEVCDEIVKEII